MAWLRWDLLGFVPWRRGMHLTNLLVGMAYKLLQHSQGSTCFGAAKVSHRYFKTRQTDESIYLD